MSHSGNGSGVDFALLGNGAENWSSTLSAMPQSIAAVYPRPISVMHVTETWNGGVGTYLEALLDQQLHDPSIREVHLACSSAKTPSQLSLEGHNKLRVHRYQSSRSIVGTLRARDAIRELVNEHAPDLLHLHSTFAGLYGRTFRTRVPIVYCAHGWAFTQELRWPLELTYSAVEAVLSKQADAIIHISHDELTAAWKRRVRARLNRVILSSVRPPRVSQTPPIAVDPSKVNLGFIGRFDRQKGAEILLQALADLDRKDVHLYLLGDFDREKGGRRLPLADARVTHLGWVRHDEIDNYISCFDAVVVPSRWEGFGLVALEAMRNSKAVLVSNRGGLPEQVIDGFNGHVFPIEASSELTELLASLDKRELARLGANGRQVWVSSFGEQRAYRRLNEIYQRVIIERTKPANDVKPASRAL